MRMSTTSSVIDETRYRMELEPGEGQVVQACPHLKT